MKILSFSGGYRYLSNFYTCNIICDGIAYSSVENAYQASKSLDPKVRQRFLNCSAYEAKKRGYSVKIRPDWEDVKLDIMYQLVKEKFTKNKMLGELLMATKGMELVEGNTWGDTFWGICDGIGENNLGKILMQIRDEMLSDTVQSVNVKTI
jgi:ribA/ribD-fused uncharacterized protein